MNCDFSNLKQADISRAIGITTRTVRRWVEAGLPRNADGTYDLPKVVQWLLDREKEDETPESRESSQWLGLYRKERYLLSKLEREQQEGGLIKREEVLRQWAWRVGEVRAGLIAFADRLPPLLEGQTRGEMYELIFEEVRGLFENFCRNGKFCPPVKLEFKGEAPGLSSPRSNGG